MGFSAKQARRSGTMVVPSAELFFHSGEKLGGMGGGENHFRARGRDVLGGEVGHGGVGAHRVVVFLPNFANRLPSDGVGVGEALDVGLTSRRWHRPR